MLAHTQGTIMRGNNKENMDRPKRNQIKPSRYMTTESDDTSKKKKKMGYNKKNNSNIHDDIANVRSLVTSTDDENYIVNSRNIFQFTQSLAASNNNSPLINNKKQFSRQPYDPVPITSHQYSLTTKSSNSSSNCSSTITSYSCIQPRTTSMPTETAYSPSFNNHSQNDISQNCIPTVTSYSSTQTTSIPVDTAHSMALNYNHPQNNIPLNFQPKITSYSSTQVQTASIPVETVNSLTSNQNISQCNTSVPTQLASQANITHSVQTTLPVHFTHSIHQNHTESSVHQLSQSDTMNLSPESSYYHSINNTQPCNNIINNNTSNNDKHYEDLTQTQIARDVNIFQTNGTDATRHNMLVTNDNVSIAIQNTQRDLQEIKEYLQREIPLLHTSLQTLVRVVNPVRPCLPRCLPLRTVEQVHQFETIDEEQYREVVRYMQYLGGFTARDAISNAFKDAITDELSRHYTWFGLEKESHPIYNTRIATAIWEAVAANVNFVAPTDTEFKHAMSECLRCAKQRLRNSARRGPVQRERLVRVQREANRHVGIPDNVDDD